ncbi:claudin-4-like [Heptranchias perlo]|uniref:claudin-4-like n=1 Tax=Heptranchias perlo TaxID=212740 RepID=UPI0035597798
MASTALEFLGFLIGVIGWMCVCAVTGMPQWKITPFIGSTILNTEITWEGIWMTCVYQQTVGRMVCDIYDSVLDLSGDVQMARAFMCLAISSGLLAIMVSTVGMKCTYCCGDDRRVKGYVAAVGGTFFLLAGLCVLVPVSWVAHNIITDFYNPLVPESLKRELGDALYVGWSACCFLSIGGGVLCCSCPTDSDYAQGYRKGYTANHPAVTTHSPATGYPLKEYV